LVSARLAVNEAGERSLTNHEKTKKKGMAIDSSWFPLVDRNPQTFVNIHTATPG
jgi:hypothetical protein